MTRNYNNIFILLAGCIFVASISSDPLIHDHLHDEHLVECELCENKAFDFVLMSLLNAFLISEAVLKGEETSKSTI